MKPTTPTALPVGAVLLFLLLPGCTGHTPSITATVATTATVSTTSQAPPTVEPPAPPPAVIELAHQNVTWIGQGSVQFSVTIPNGTKELAYGWRSESVADFPVALKAHGFGCPDGTSTGEGGIGAGWTTNRWCNNPQTGTGIATITLTAGTLSNGSVCLLAYSKVNSTLTACS